MNDDILKAMWSDDENKDLYPLEEYVLQGDYDVIFLLLPEEFIVESEKDKKILYSR